MRLFIALVLASTLVCGAADWKANNPEVLRKSISKVGGDAFRIEVRVRFKDNATPQNIEEKVYLRGGLGAWDAIKLLAFADQDTLDELELVPDAGTTFAPTEPTRTDQAILDVQEASRRLCALEGYAALTGLAGTDNVAGTSITVDAPRTRYETVINNQVTTAPNINERLLDPWINCVRDRL